MLGLNELRRIWVATLTRRQKWKLTAHLEGLRIFYKGQDIDNVADQKLHSYLRSNELCFFWADTKEPSSTQEPASRVKEISHHLGEFSSISNEGGREQVPFGNRLRVTTLKYQFRQGLKRNPASLQVTVWDSGKNKIHFSSNLVNVSPSQSNAMQWPGMMVKIRVGTCVQLAITNLEGIEPRETNQGKSLVLSWQRSCACHAPDVSHSSSHVQGV